MILTQPIYAELINEGLIKVYADGSIAYIGKLTNPTEVIKKAYTSHQNQKQRCNDPNKEDYHRYGARGVSVYYDRRDFIGWYLTEFFSRDVWNDWPVCSRTGDQGDYEFGNITLKERSQNAKEIKGRNLFPTARPVKAVEIGTGVARKFNSIKEASRHFKCSNGTLSNVLRNGTDTYVGHRWEYL